MSESRRKEVEHGAVWHREQRPAVLFDHGRETENLATQLLHRRELIGLESDAMPGDALDLHASNP
jgi:hypothetical protein